MERFLKQIIARLNRKRKLALVATLEHSIHVKTETKIQKWPASGKRSINSQADGFFHHFFVVCFTNKKLDFKTQHTLRSFLFHPEVGKFAEFKLQTENLILKLKNKRKQPASWLATFPLLCLSELQKLILFCASLVFVHSSYHPYSHQRALAKSWQQAVAPPGGNKDFYSQPLQESLFMEITPSTGHSQTRTVCTTELVFSADLTFCF